MPSDVVIVSAARTPIATAYKGSLVGVDAFALAEVAIGGSFPPPMRGMAQFVPGLRTSTSGSSATIVNVRRLPPSACWP